VPEKSSTLLVSATDVSRLLDLTECISAVEKGFLLLGQGKLPPPQILGLHADGGGLHIKAALWRGDRSYFVAKANANFPGNPAKHGLPTIQGVIIISDAETGELLALIDSIEITAQRTAAASAVAAKYLARPDSHALAIFGCGRQGFMHAHALSAMLPITTIHAVEPNDTIANRFADSVAEQLHVTVRRFSNPVDAIRDAEIIATCTPSKQFFIRAEDVRPGTFITAVGADNEHKQEIDPALFAKSKVVVDSLDQCATIGDLHHAIAAGSATRASVHAELAEIVAGTKPGRANKDEITLFDSTGIAIEDAAAATYVFEKAQTAEKKTVFEF
jgi:ornithine cyclodeaminase/alanine dehydrogenase-like protein (mu-crystallin family)